VPEAKLHRRNVLRTLKSGDIGLVEAASDPGCCDERLLDLIGFALIGTLKGPDRFDAGRRALEISYQLDVGPYLTPRTAPPELIERCAQAIAASPPAVRQRPPQHARALLPLTPYLAPFGLITWPYS
jgi:hypothetical protein